MPLVDLIHSKYTNRIIVDIGADKFTTNLITYYLDNCRNKIIQGVFPLKLLDSVFLKNKYYKITLTYEKLGYKFVDNNKLIDVLKYLNDNSINDRLIKDIYIILTYEVKNIIPVNVRSPLIGYRSKQEAINSFKIKNKNKKSFTNIFIYKVDPENFQVRDNVIITRKPVKILNMEKDSIY
jgi:hypothetical protein